MRQAAKTMLRLPTKTIILPEELAAAGAGVAAVSVADVVLPRKPIRNRNRTNKRNKNLKRRPKAKPKTTTRSPEATTVNLSPRTFPPIVDASRSN